MKSSLHLLGLLALSITATLALEPEVKPAEKALPPPQSPAATIPVEEAPAEEAPAAPKNMRDWRPRLPTEVSSHLDEDRDELLRVIGYDPRPEQESGKKPYLVKMWGHDTENFDDDETNDWVVHVRTMDFLGRPVAGSLIYDQTETGWICIARLRGTFATGWGDYANGRMGIRTLEGVPEESPSTQRERYFRWNGKSYIEDRVEYLRSE